MIGNTSTIGSNTAYASGNLPTKRSIDNIGFGSSKLWFFKRFVRNTLQDKYPQRENNTVSDYWISSNFYFTSKSHFTVFYTILQNRLLPFFNLFHPVYNQLIPLYHCNLLIAIESSIALQPERGLISCIASYISQKILTFYYNQIPDSYFRALTYRNYYFSYIIFTSVYFILPFFEKYNTIQTKFNQLCYIQSYYRTSLYYKLISDLYRLWG